MFGRDRSITKSREEGATRPSYNERNRASRDRNTTGGDPRYRTLDSRATIDRQIPSRSLNSTLIWTLRASLPGRLGGPAASSPGSDAGFIYLVAHIRGKGSCRSRVIQMETTLGETGSVE